MPEMGDARMGTTDGTYLPGTKAGETTPMAQSYPKQSERKEAQPKFDWDKLRKTIEGYEKLGLRYIPLVWGDKKPAGLTTDHTNVARLAFVEKAG